jgi:trimeric autotransporter adhesin
MKAKGLLLTSALLLSGCGLQMGFPDYPEGRKNNEENTNQGHRIFLTDGVTDGRIGTGGVAAADAFCAADKNRPKDGTYRALLVDGLNRVAESGKQKDWVLKANTKYVRLDKGEIGTTNANGVFPLPLKSPIGFTSTPVWVGLGSSWQAGNHCSGWTSNAPASANAGQASQVGEGAFFGATVTCDTQLRLYCVEQ